MIPMRDTRGMDVIVDKDQSKRKGCSCVGILITLIIIGVIFLGLLAVNSDEFNFFYITREVRDSAFNDLFFIVVILIALVPVVLIITRYLNRQQQIPL
ncbi:MAG: hypothetical protein JW779_14130 [Candidatus Thorarchaeota archaeon]|nr:hypothetical protein [Candidatus Thorarchaeota archaeon]